MKYSILLLVAIISLTCSDANVSEPYMFPVEKASAGVQHKIFYPDLQSNKPLSIQDFEYKNNLLQKINYYDGNRNILYHYEYLYYSNSELKYKLGYHNNLNALSGFILIDSTIYVYSGEQLSEVRMVNPIPQYDERYIYEYYGEYPVKKTVYYGDELQSYTIYEYDKGLLKKETNYYKDVGVTETKVYSYKGDVLQEVIIYGSSGSAKRRISYSYNPRGKLIMEDVDELWGYSSSASHIIRYEY